MTKSQFCEFAREIRMLKGIMPERYRLDCAVLIRDVLQFSTNWPGWNQFQRQCEIDMNQVQAEKHGAAQESHGL